MPAETEVHAAVLAGIASGVTPAVSLAYGDCGSGDLDGIAEVLAAGRTQLGDEGLPVTPDTRFDVASLTKPVTTTAVLMRLVADGTVALGDALQRFVPEAAPDVTLAQLVGHASGYPAHLEFFRRLLDGDLANQPTARHAIVQLAATTPQSYSPGTQTIYSDLGFILLATCLERATGERLDALTARLVTEPLGMHATGFVDLTASPPAPRPHPVAATEVCPYRGLVRGEVHDDNCHAAGGICGHAGLFSTAPDLARFARAMLAAARDEPGVFDPAVVRTFLATSAAPETTWRLGWDRPAPLPSRSHAGDLWPRDGIGHLGFTGCSMWLDPPRGRYAILLTNRVHPSRDKAGILEVRRAYMDAAWRALNAR